MWIKVLHLRATDAGHKSWSETNYGNDSDTDCNIGLATPMLTFHSLFQLRGYLANAIILESNAEGISAIADDIRRVLKENESCDAKTASTVIENLKTLSKRNDRRKRLDSVSSASSLWTSTSDKNNFESPVFTITSSATIFDSEKCFTGNNSIGQSAETISYQDGASDSISTSITLPIDTETPYINVIVVPITERPVFIMVRLINTRKDPSCSSFQNTSTRPRFLYIFAGPASEDVDYEELSKALSSLLSLPSFDRLAQITTRPEPLLIAIDDFLKKSVVIPFYGGFEKDEKTTLYHVHKEFLKCREQKTVEAQRKKSEPDTFSEDTLFHLPTSKEKDQFVVERKISSHDEANTSLQRTGRLFGGLIQDLVRRFPHYADDIRDAFNFQCVMSVVFIFFITCASAIAFGELLDEKTNGRMGVSEMLVAHAVCNVVWGLISGQPLCIQAGIGLLLAFEGSLYKYCESYEIDFLAMRVWTGLWVVVLMLLITMLEGSCLVRYLTRFTEETLTCLIAFFFLWEAGSFFISEFAANPVRTLFDYCFNNGSSSNRNLRDVEAAPVQLVNNNADVVKFKMNGTDYIVATLKSHPGTVLQLPPGSSQPDTALLTLILALLTFGLVYCLTRLRSSKYFGRTIRNVISDLAVPIALVVVALFDRLVFKDVHVRHLDIPVQFGITTPCHRDGWFVWPMGNGVRPMPDWAILAALVPAVSVCILVFAEVELAEMLLSKPERQLKRSQGFHWDLVVCGLLIFVCSLFGLPWMCTGTVQTVAHVNSLTVTKRSGNESESARKVDRVIEQRVTCVAIGLLHGAVAFAGAALQLIPVAVLFGIFIFLGVTGLSELQLTQRISLLFVPPKHFPRLPFCTKIPTWRMHLFTVIQIVCAGALCVLKIIPPASFMFPYALLAIVALRQFVLPRLFSKSQLEAIDGEKEKEETGEFAVADVACNCDQRF